MKYLEICSLYSAYQNKDGVVNALNGLNLSLDKETVTGLVGPNGSGKTTLLKVIVGTQYFQEGNLFLADKNLENIPSNKRNISYLSQNIVLFPHWTVFENIAYPLKNKKMPLSLIIGKVEGVAKRFGLEPFLTRMPSQLSLGQQQKVLLAKCLVRDAELYLLDEPFSNIDEESKKELITYIKNEIQLRKLTVIIVSHVLQDILELTDSILFIEDGKIINQKDTDEVKRKTDLPSILIKQEIDKKKL